MKDAVGSLGLGSRNRIMEPADRVGEVPAVVGQTVCVASGDSSTGSGGGERGGAVKRGSGSRR